MTRVVIHVAVVLLTVVTAACAARGGVPRPFPGAALPPGADETAAERPQPPEGSSVEAPAATPPSMVSDVIRTALAYLGVPYRNGGSDPSGFDCSGFTQWVFGQHGLTLPREVRDQFHVGRRIDLKDAQPGDLIFFETVTRGASHVGMVIGQGRFVHAPTSKGVVRIEPYTAKYWNRRFVGARRMTEVSASVAVPAPFPGSLRSAR
jgi:cell wall-associated NlpC family hydrolase